MDSFIQSKHPEDQDFYRVVNLKNKKNFFFFFFLRGKGGVELVVCTVSKRFGMISVYFVLLFFFYYSRTFCKQPPKCKDSAFAYGWSFVKSSLCVRCEQNKKKNEAWGRE